LYDEEAYPHGSSGWNDARDTSDINLMQQAIALDVPMFAVCRGEQGFNIAMGGSLIQDVPTYLGEQVKAGKIDESRATVIEDKGITTYTQNADGSYSSTTTPCEPEHYRVYVDGLIHSGGDGYHVLDAGENGGIGISKDSKWLYQILGVESIDLVATAHHQAVNPEDLGTGLTIVATSSDGIVEAIEHQDSTFALAIQWHPERDALGDSRMTDTNDDGVKDTPIDVDQDLCNKLLRALVTYADVHQDAQNQEPASATPGRNKNHVTSTPASNATTTTTPTTTTPTETTTPTDTSTAVERFSDVKADDWFAAPVNYVLEKNLMTGTSDNSFDPDTNLTRAMIAQILFSYDADSQAGVTSDFTDVSGAWYTDAVNWCASQKLVSGVGGGKFDPNASISRQDLALILYNYAVLKGYDVTARADLSGFGDNDQISSYAVTAIQWANAAGLISGMDNGTLAPAATATRAQVATILMGFCENVAK
jgi:gamma-glutamyl-gamma-aminobutyrate hydrolase PuuD